MILSLIAAMSENRVIGYHEKIPWNIPSDQKLFQKTTMGHPIVLGRTTFESIGKALPGRRNIVLTRKPDYHADDVLVVHSIEEALAACRDEGEIFICGGGIVFHETIALADRIYLSIIHRSYHGDTFFPEIPSFFKEDRREEVENDPPYSFIRYIRIP